MTGGRRTGQAEAWSGPFGKEYTDRNPRTPEAMDALFDRRFGVTRTDLNEEFLGDLSRDIRILEVGANVGTQLSLLRAQGFKNLWGAELMFYAIQESAVRRDGIEYVQASGFDLPFPDESFDLVFTSGVLIHLAPDKLARAMDEVVRCTRRYIWGYEYFAKEHVPIPYRGREDLMWKGDFSHMYCEGHPDLRRIKERRLVYLDSDNVDAMFLLDKPAPHGDAE
ncbi:MAG: methyltransferase domain-containing protein [bacterium]|nr:methyltransferase domain-containing protein [bacterium]